MGLSVKWASCNFGANTPEKYGDYFAWGETAPYYTAGHSQDDPCNNWKDNKTGYNWASYKFRTSGNSLGDLRFYKYNTSSDYGAVDNKTVLAPGDDVAHIKLGGKWRMPTIKDWEELLDECTWTWTTQNGVNGARVTGTNGNSIFLPAAGRGGADLYDAGSYGYYWSSSLDTGGPNDACFVFFYSDGVRRYGSSRCYGFSVRPVTE